MATCCGYVVRSVTIIPNALEEGATYFDRPSSEEEELLAGKTAAVCRCVLVALAGLAADSIYIGASGLAATPPAWAGHIQDRREALNVLAHFRGAADYQGFQLGAALILARAGRAAVIADLATALLADGVVEGESITPICRLVAPLDEEDMKILAKALPPGPLERGGAIEPD